MSNIKAAPMVLLSNFSKYWARRAALLAWRKDVPYVRTVTSKCLNRWVTFLSYVVPLARLPRTRAPLYKMIKHVVQKTCWTQQRVVQ